MLIEHLPGDPESFSVIPYNDPHPNQIKLTARNRDQKRKWAQHIKQVMLAHFDIPSRAKELLFKLGEEEDRSTDKNTWRWNNSSTTPEYLERRNQYRRSEMRYRSKKQRKLFNASLSMVEDQFDPLPANTLANNDRGKSKAIDSIVKELQQRNSLIKQNEDTESITSTATQVTDVESRADDNDDLSIGNEYEIPFDANKALPNKPASALDKAKSKLLEVRIYNTKTLPKRIANLKKQRSKTLKETSKFYMELEDSTDTVLKITETSDDLQTISEVHVNRRRASLDANDTISKALDENTNRKLSSVSLLTPENLNQKLAMNKNKRDTDIISELLKDHKEFDRILKKPPKKLLEAEKISPIHENRNSKFPKGDAFFKLPLPPIPVEANESNKTESFVQRELPPEPIYESLLRNVHVPYKFPSPVLNRSLSQPNSRLKVKRPTEAPPKRPDSDYVTLTYDENGEINGIDDDIRLPKHGSHFRKSDTNINYHVRKMSDEKVPSIESFSSLGEGSRRSTSSEIDYIVSVSNIQATKSSDLLTSQTASHDISLNGTEVHKSVDQLNLGKTSSKLPERRVSDVTGMHRKSIIHKQGSKALGSRIASVDYADPKILFSNNNSYISLTKPFIQSLANIQRDSAFSLTSSNDSVNTSASHCGQDAPMKRSTETKSTANVIYTNDPIPETVAPSLDVCKTSPSNSTSSNSSNSGDDSYYEKTVETYLEDGIFRDSAIYLYSDDNNEKPYSRPEHIYSTIDEVKQETKPAVPPKLNFHKVNASVITRSAPPPPVPAKPCIAAPILPAKGNVRFEQTVEKLMSTPLPPPPVEETTVKTASLESSAETTKRESIITKKQRELDEIDTNNEGENSETCQVIRVTPPATVLTPPPVPARNFAGKNSSWVMKQIQNFEK